MFRDSSDFADFAGGTASRTLEKKDAAPTSLPVIPAKAGIEIVLGCLLQQSYNCWVK